MGACGDGGCDTCGCDTGEAINPVDGVGYKPLKISDYLATIMAGVAAEKFDHGADTSVNAFDKAFAEGVPVEPYVPAFNAAANKTLQRATEVHMQRGNEYQDSWALENVHAPFVTHVLREVFGLSGASPEELRLIIAASLVDVKISRMGGAFKVDTCDDMVNYVASFTTWMESYQVGG